MADKKKEFVPLETIEEQMSILDGIPYEQQLPGLNDYKLDKGYYELLNTYLSQNLKGLDSLMNNIYFVNTNYNNSMLVGRNLKWIPKIEELIKNESTFIAVGCAHLIGENGLINMLTKQGYTLQPIYFSFTQ